MIVPWLMLSALLPIAAVSAQGGVKASARKLRSAIRAIDVTEESGQRVLAAIDALKKFDGRVSARALLDAVEALDGQVMAVAEGRRKALLGEGGSGRLKRGRYELRNLSDAGEAVASALQGLKSQAALAAMLERLIARGSALPLWFRLRLAQRMGELSDVKVDWQKTRIGKDGPDALLGLIEAASALGTRAGTACGRWLVQQLEHQNADVQAAAARALSGLAWPGAIEPLIDRLDVEQGAARERVLDALVVLTAQNPGASSKSWRAWLAAEGAPFLSGARALSQGDVSMREHDPAANTAAGAYFGIDQTGRGIVYVFDNSLSMKVALKGDSGKGKGPTTGGPGTTRWQLCKLELRRGLRGLRPDQQFNLVSFANKARCFAPTLQFATEENVARAIEWIDDLKLEFQTNVYDALELAFQIAGRGVGDRYYAPSVDTMFFLSDGAPTIANLKAAGITQDDSDRILRAVERWNALGRIRIHAVALGLQKRNKDRNKKGRLWPYVFLKRLAEQNRGDFVLKR